MYTMYDIIHNIQHTTPNIEFGKLLGIQINLKAFRKLNIQRNEKT